jgi:RNA polymerase sigma factor (sigma-70 family)
MGKPGFALKAKHESNLHDGQDYRALIGQAASGDQSAWELLIERYTPYLDSIGRAYELSHEETSDARQETWVKVVKYLSGLRDPARFRPWLAAIMRHSCKGMIQCRQHGRDQLLGDLTDMIGGSLRDESVDVEHEILAAERASIVRQALCLLPERERRLLHCLVTDDLSYEEITRHLSIPMGSIGPTRMRALSRLRLILEQIHASDLLAA